MIDIYVIGYPKVGTTWLSRLLGDIFDSPVGAIDKDAISIATEGQDRTGNYYIGQGHPIPSTDENIPSHLRIDPNTDARIILMIRDPRDVCVSAMYHWEMDGLETAIDCICNGKWPLTHGGGIAGFYEAWWDRVNSIPNIPIIKYERLHSYPEQKLSSLYYHLTNYPVPTEKIREAIERQSFYHRREWTRKHGGNLSYGKDFQLRFLRKGIVGDWRNHFTKENEDYINEHLGDFMKKWGYALN